MLTLTRRIAPAVLAVALLAACGSDSGSSDTNSEPSPSSGGSSAAGGGAELLVWADNSANTAKAIEPLCKQWAQENGVTCTVRKFNGGAELETALENGNTSGNVPDIFENAHNGIGTYVSNGIIAPIDLGANSGSFLPASVESITYDGATYGVPWAVENVALMTNKKLSPQCPGTLDEAVANASQLIDQGRVTPGLGIAVQIGETGDGYHWYPLFSADGGYSFKQNEDGTFDPADLGVGKDGSVAASERLTQLVDDGMVKASVTYDIAREAFAQGKAPYFITGPWQIPEQQEALGADLQVCPVPTWEDSQFPSQPFLGMRVFYQTAKAKNPALASTFLNDYVMTTEFMDGMYAVDPRPPAWTESYEKAASDPLIAGFGEYGKDGVPMPNIPEMGAVFGELGLAQYKIATGAPPEATIKAAGASIEKQNAELG